MTNSTCSFASKTFTVQVWKLYSIYKKVDVMSVGSIQNNHGSFVCMKCTFRSHSVIINLLFVQKFFAVCGVFLHVVIV